MSKIDARTHQELPDITGTGQPTAAATFETKAHRPQKVRHPVIRQTAWLVFIWVCSVTALGMVSMGFRYLMNAAGFQS
ncbi:DUF2474 domain-containing protein [Photobacterium ganghwense]|uniref:DUF2474 domain-containing protein n=1 Tax=Photobacterium ganghwense TaxID=320778 RepID=UPI004056F4BD